MSHRKFGRNEDSVTQRMLGRPSDSAPKTIVKSEPIAVAPGAITVIKDMGPYIDLEHARLLETQPDLVKGWEILALRYGGFGSVGSKVRVIKKLERDKRVDNDHERFAEGMWDFYPTASASWISSQVKRGEMKPLLQTSPALTDQVTPNQSVQSA
jgi:hypothetical protein